MVERSQSVNQERGNLVLACRLFASNETAREIPSLTGATTGSTEATRLPQSFSKRPLRSTIGRDIL
jgi:hypothetical protein